MIGEAEPIWPLTWSCPACGHRIETADDFPMFAPTLADTISGVNPGMFESLSRLEGNNFWFVPRNRLITALLRRYFPAARTFMELGCGSGFVLSSVAAIKHWDRLVGSELHPSGLSIARQRLGGRAEFVQMDARDIPARDVFDVIGIFDVIEHIEEDEAVLAAMHRATCGGGGIMLAVPQHPWLWSEEDEAALHVRRYRRGELERKVKAAGFDLLFSGSYTTLLLPLMVASRWRRRAKADAPPSKKSHALGREIDLPDLLNGLLKAILQTEVSLSLAGLHFPIGGSRVIVAAKSTAQATTS